MAHKRNSNIEILRILSILMITISHYSVHSGISSASLNFGLNRFLFEFFTLGNIGVIIFILITGFFGIERENPFKMKKVIFLWLQVVFYSLLIYLVLVLFGKEIFSLKELLKCLFPIAFKRYWFISAYFILYILMPYINKLINSLSRKEHFSLICISMCFFSIMHMLTGQDYYGNELIQLILFYCIGAYLNKYRNNIFSKNKLNVILLVIVSLLMISSIIIFDIIGYKYSIFSTHSTYLMNRTSILSIIFAICIFSIFSNRDFSYNKYINSISSYVLGIYLISDNPMIRKILWSEVFNTPKYAYSNILIIHMILCVIATCIVCIFIEFLRKNIFERMLNIAFNKLKINDMHPLKRIYNYYEKWCEKDEKKIKK